MGTFGLLDLSAAFNTVDHGDLIHKLGVDLVSLETLCTGLDSYLENRSQFIQP